MSVPFANSRLLHAELVIMLRIMIMDGMFRPGDWIDEERLCKRFGVSRTPLCEACRILSAEGLLSLVPNRSVIVSVITREEAEDIFPVLGMLQALAGELMCERIDDAGAARIRAMHDRIVQCYQAGNVEAYVEFDRAIHFAIFEAAGNRVLTDTHYILNARLYRIKHLLRVTPPPIRWAAAVDDHEQMIHALEARDGPGFASIARRHIEHNAEFVRHGLDDLEQKMNAMFETPDPRKSVPFPTLADMQSRGRA